MPEVDPFVRPDQRSFNVDILKRVRALEALVLMLDTIKVPVSETTSGDHTVVAADADQKIRVISVSLLASGNVDIQWKSAAGVITGVYPVPRRGGYVLPENQSGWFETDINEALVLNMSAAVTLGGSLTYILTDE